MTMVITSRFGTHSHTRVLCESEDDPSGRATLLREWDDTIKACLRLFSVDDLVKNMEISIQTTDLRTRCRIEGTEWRELADEIEREV